MARDDPAVWAGDRHVQRLVRDVWNDDQMQDQGRFDPLLLAGLSDAMEEAGCVDRRMLRHLRRKQGHAGNTTWEPSGPCPLCLRIFDLVSAHTVVTQEEPPPRRGLATSAGWAAVRD